MDARSRPGAKLWAGWLGAAALAATLVAGCNSDSAGACDRVDEPDRPDLVFRGGIGADAEIYTARADGSDVRRLVRNEGLDGYPSFSPDGCRIAFVGSADEGDALYVSDADGGKLEQLASGLNFDASGTAFSPDGEEIAVGANPGGIVTVDDGGRVAPLFGATLLAVGEEFFEAEPTWSPDGEQVAFAGLPRAEVDEGGLIVTDIYVADVEEGEPEPLTETPDLAEGEPSWSPNGDLIAFVNSGASPPGVTGGSPGGLFVVPAEGGATRRLSGGVASSPTWTPDSRFVVFSRQVGYQDREGVGTPLFDLVAVPAAGGRERVIMSSVPALYDPEWSPAGESIKPAP